jgi:membrane protein YdbS with pleckstrin-like domain
MKKVKKKGNRKKIRNLRSSRKLYMPHYFMIVLLALFLGYIKYTGRIINDAAFNVVLFFAIVIIVATEIHRLGESYYLTSSSIILDVGYFGILSKRMEFEAISDIQILQGPWQRLLNFGDVQLFKFGPGPIMKNINRPNAFVNELEQIITKAKAGEHEEE